MTIDKSIEIKGQGQLSDEISDTYHIDNFLKIEVNFLYTQIL